MTDEVVCRVCDRDHDFEKHVTVFDRDVDVRKVWLLCRRIGLGPRGSGSDHSDAGGVRGARRADVLRRPLLWAVAENLPMLSIPFTGGEPDDCFVCGGPHGIGQCHSAVGAPPSWSQINTRPADPPAQKPHLDSETLVRCDCGKEW